MRGMLFQDAVNVVKAELMQSMDAAHQPSWIDTIGYKLEGTQQDLALAHDWPFLEKRTEVLLPAARFIPMPSGVTVEAIRGITVQEDGRRNELGYGVGTEQYNIMDSIAGIGGPVVRRWHYWDSGPEPFYDDFSTDTSPEWAYAGEAVDGVISVAAGSLRYTVGAGDGARPRIARPVNVIKGLRYRIKLPAPTGTVGTREIWVSSDGGSIAAALTTVASNAALDEEFTAPADGFGVVWIVVRAGAGSAAGETIEISEAELTPVTRRVIELWPIPETADVQTITITYRGALAPFREEGHVSTLDGRLVALFAAADIATSRGGKDAERIDAKARQRLAMVLEDNKKARAFLPRPVIKESTGYSPRYPRNF